MDLKSNNTFAILREEEKKEISLEIEFKRDTSATYLAEITFMEIWNTANVGFHINF